MIADALSEAKFGCSFAYNRQLGEIVSDMRNVRKLTYQQLGVHNLLV